MLLRQLVEALELEVLTCRQKLEREVTAGYASDMLSYVMANAPEGSVWVTVQVHQNVVAVAMLRSLAAILLVGDRSPEQSTLDKAEQEGVCILRSRLSAFEVVGRMYEAGIRGGGG